MKKLLCWLLALLLTCALVLFGLSYIGAQAVNPAFREGGTVVSNDVQKAEMELIREKIAELAPVYGFSAETAMQHITAEKLAEMNVQAAVWWNSLLTNGEAGEAPVFDTEELISAFAEDLMPAGGDQEEADEETELQATDAANIIAKSVLRIVLPLRLPVISIGTSKAAERVDVGNVIRFLTGIRWAALAVCILLAGLIALIESRKLRTSLKYIGSAMGAAVLVMAGGAVLYCLSGIEALIAEASPSLSVQYDSLFTGAAIRLIVYAAILTAGCIICLIFFRRPHEAKAD